MEHLMLTILSFVRQNRLNQVNIDFQIESELWRACFRQNIKNRCSVFHLSCVMYFNVKDFVTYFCCNLVNISFRFSMQKAIDICQCIYFTVHCNLVDFTYGYVGLIMQHITRNIARIYMTLHLHYNYLLTVGIFV